MDRNKVYDYFMLQANLWQAIINWHREHLKYEDIEFQGIPYKILYVNLVDGGCINIGIEYIDGNSIISKEYRIPVKDLENV